MADNSNWFFIQENLKHEAILPIMTTILVSHRENHRSADRDRQNTRRTGKPPLYNHVWNQENQAKFRLGPTKAQKFHGDCL